MTVHRSPRDTPTRVIKRALPHFGHSGRVGSGSIAWNHSLITAGAQSAGEPPSEGSGGIRHAVTNTAGLRGRNRNGYGTCSRDVFNGPLMPAVDATPISADDLRLWVRRLQREGPPGVVALRTGGLGDHVLYHCKRLAGIRGVEWLGVKACSPTRARHRRSSSSRRATSGRRTRSGYAKCWPKEPHERRLRL